MPEQQHLVYLSLSNAGLPKTAQYFEGTIGQNVGPADDRLIAKGYTEDHQFIMRWADTGRIFPLSDDELPREVGEIKPVERPFGDIVVRFGVEKTDRGHRIASLQRIEPQNHSTI